MLASGCSLVPKAVSGIAEATAFVCDGDLRELRGSILLRGGLEAGTSADPGAYHGQLDLGSDLQTPAS